MTVEEEVFAGTKPKDAKPFTALVIGLMAGITIGAFLCFAALSPRLTTGGLVSTNTYLPNKIVRIEGYEFALFKPDVNYVYSEGTKITVLKAYPNEEIAVFSGWVDFQIVPIGAEPK